MAVPDFQTMMMPFLEISGDGLEHTYGEMADLLAQIFNLSDDEKKRTCTKGQAN